MYKPSIPCAGNSTTQLGGGLGCIACNGTCGGLGLFDSMDFTSWGIAEWAVVGVGAYLVLSLAGDTRRAAVRVKRSVRRRRNGKR
jgi:hypothetical protein